MGGCTRAGWWIFLEDNGVVWGRLRTLLLEKFPFFTRYFFLLTNFSVFSAAFITVSASFQFLLPGKWKENHIDSKLPMIQS